MKTPRSIGILSALVLGALIFLPAAGFSSEIWTHVGSACVVDEGDQSDYEFSGGELRFKSGATGYVYARCNVVNPRDSGGSPWWNTLEVTFRDPDGAGTSNQVQVTLYRVSNATGSASGVKTFNSNSFAGTGVQTQYELFSHSFNFDAYAYFVQIRLYRAASGTPNTSAFIVRLVETIY